jgi:hypothetical protein
MNRTWPFLLGLLLLPVATSAQSQFTYTINDGDVTITGYYGFDPKGVFIVPSTIDNLPVTGIGDYAFDDLDSITNATIPASVTNIGAGAFFDCVRLTAIIVDAQNSFYSSTNGVLFDKNQTTLIECPGGLTGNYAIPGGVASVAAGAFEDCSGLTNIAIPGSVIAIGAGAFSDCASLTAMTVDATNSFYTSVDGVLFNKSQTTLIQCPGGLAGDFIVPGGVTNIGDNAFVGCSKLIAITVNATNSFYSSAGGVLFDKNQTTLIDYPGGVAGNYTVPGSVTNIGIDAFEDCKNLTGITIPGNVISIGAGAFENCSGLATLTITVGATNIGSNAFENCSTLTSVTIPASVTSIGAGAFENCFDLAYLSIASGVTDIGANAFEDCYRLTVVRIPGGVTNIGAGAFDYCLSLDTVTVPDTVISIGEEAFENCSSLAGIVIPNSVTNIGAGAFAYSSSLTGITLPDAIASIAQGMFYECASLTNVTIPESVSSIGEEAFDQCYDLASITIPDNVSSIGETAFYNCTSLTTVMVPSSVTNIGNQAFSDCASLTAITVDATNSFYSSLGGVLFDKNQSTVVEYPGGLPGNYTIPGSVTSIGEEAFNETGLTSVTIPASVTSIGAGAFSGCASLTNIYFTGDAPAVDSSVFDSSAIPAIYYLPGTTGWAEFSASAGLAATPWNPVIQTADSGFGVQSNQFGFNVTGPSNLVVVVEACANLSEPVWTPLQTVTLAGGQFHFSEPVQTNLPSRFYGLGFP